MARFYQLSLQGRLQLEEDAPVSLVREWGRIGSPGTVRVEAHPTQEAAEVAASRLTERKKRRGYH
jgi:predicted DNA-binding WGR domain protein